MSPSSFSGIAINKETWKMTFPTQTKGVILFAKRKEE
jgi:hypothetical protein